MSEHNKNNTFALKSFRGISVWNSIDILSENIVHKGNPTTAALYRIKHVLSIAKLYCNTPDGIAYEAQSGVSIDSPYWVSLACNDRELMTSVRAKLQRGRGRYDFFHIAKLEEATTSEVNSLLEVFNSPCFLKTDAEAYDEFANSANSQDYSFFENASKAAKIRAHVVARNFGYESIDREKLKAFGRYLKEISDHEEHNELLAKIFGKTVTPQTNQQG